MTPTVFFLIVLPTLQWVGYLVFLLFAGAIIASYVKQVIIVYYRTKAVYAQTLCQLQSDTKDTHS